MQIVDFATRRRITVLMFTVAIVLFGLVSLSRLKLNLLPDLSYPTLTIRTDLPGAAPLELENLVTRPVEEAVGVIRNVRQVRSVSRAGQSDVILEFTWGTDMDLAGIDVREKLDLLELPIEASRPLLLRFDPSSEPVMRLAFIDTEEYASSERALRESAEDRLKALRRFADDRLKPELESVAGSAAVKVSGGFEDEIHVFVDQGRLAQLGLSIETIARRLGEENVNLSGGRLEQGTQRFLVRTLNEFTTVEEMADSIIAVRQGQPIYLRDVARVEHGHKDREAITRVNGRESVELAIYKEGDANTVQLAAGVRERLEALSKNLPAGSELEVVYDQSRFISSAIGEVRQAAVIGGILAILVLYLFLRDARATLITGVAIPVSVIGTFVLMYAFDLSLNIMSLGGIALAVGMLVDNSVVVLESIVRRREQGLSRVDAAREGTREVATAVTAATLTSVAVFFPMVFITGVAGQLFRDQALTVTFALVFSLVVAVTLVPMLAAGGPTAAPTAGPAPGPVARTLATWVRRLRQGGRALSRASSWLLAPAVRATQAGFGAVERRYQPALAWSLAHRGRVVATAIAALLVTASIVPRLGTELIPQLAQGEFILDLRLAPGTPLEQTDRAVEAAQRFTLEEPGVTQSYSVTGTGNRLDANPTDAGENTGRISVTLAPGSDREDEERAIADLRGKLDLLPGVQYQFSRPALFAFATPLEVEIAGYDLARLRGTAEQLRLAMEASPRFSDIKSTVEAGNPEIQVVFDQERASQLGLEVRELADRVVSSVRGDVATRYKLREKNIDVLVRSVDTRASSVEEVRNLIVNPGSERPVPLSAVAEVRVATGPAEVRRARQERVAIVSANLAGGDLGSAVAELEGIVAGIDPPAGISMSVSGQSEEMKRSFDSLQFTLLLAVFLVYLVMASQFESLLHPFVILLTIPLALIGAVWAMFATGTTVNVVAYIGLIMLAGIVVNQSIVLIDAVNQARQRGMEKHEAILHAGQARLRPILITKLTTVLGLLPMALGLGEGAEIRQPMAITVIGGVLVASLFTLLVIPVVYSLLDRKRFAPAGAVGGAPLPSPVAAPDRGD